MNDALVRMRLVLVLILATCTAGIWLLPPSVADIASPYLQVHFLDVGQGDAILIETPNGVQVLIDGGKDRTVLQELARVMSFSDKTIDLVVGTHPDADHIGGLTHVFNQYEVDAVLTTENKSKSEIAVLYDELKETEGADILFARRGQEFALDASSTLRVLFPETNPEEMESNTASIVLQLIYGNATFMFTADAPKSIEEYLVLTQGANLKSDVLKVGHHGSRTSTSELFLDEVRPAFAVISAGKDNSYGHPHLEVTDLLFNTRVETYQTAQEGTITFLSDGATVWKQE